MYKVLLCWRYLRTRYLAMVCIVSVMLGVCTLIVVNSVMSGFSSKLRARLHDFQSDITVESIDLDGFADPDGKMALIRADPWLDERIVAMAPTMEVFAMIQFHINNTPVARPVRLIGIDPESRNKLGGFGECLVMAPDKGHPTFEISREAQAHYEANKFRRGLFQLPPPEAPLVPGEKPPPDPPPGHEEMPESAILGYAIAHYRDPKAHAGDTKMDIRTLSPGDDVVLTTVSGQRLAPVSSRFVVADYFKSEMSEYDANFVFVPLAYLQKLRVMENRVTSIQIRLKDYGNTKDVEEIQRRLKDLFAHLPIVVQTWEEKQGPLLAAIRVERGILNLLLFLIIAVAGFMILAIFSMIVVEKTKDIGILKALGASNGGVLNIFLSYGFLLGLVGASAGTLLGLTLTININNIEEFLAKLTGMDIFPRNVYYFDQIPTDIQPLTVLLVNFGAVAIAVLFSILPALRAALLHPVQALRYE